MTAAPLRPLTAIYYSHGDVPGVSLFARSTVTASLARARAGGRDVRVVAIVPAASMPMMPNADGWTSIARETLRPGLLDAYLRIVSGLALAETDAVCLIEHDVLYPPGYLSAIDIAPANPAAISYWPDVWRMSWEHGFFRSANLPGGRTAVMSGAVAMPSVLFGDLSARITHIEHGGRMSWAEPGRSGHGFTSPAGMDMLASAAAGPIIDVRHGRNHTGRRQPADPSIDLDRIPDAATAGCWPSASDLWALMAADPKKR